MGRGRTVAYARYLESRELVRPGHLLAHFLSSHDVEGAWSLLGGDPVKLRLAAALQLTTSGLPVIFYGEEVGRHIGKWPYNRGDMPWGDRAILPGAGVARDEGLRDFYRALIAARRAHPALAHGRQRTLSTEGDLLVFQRTAADEALLVAVNRGPAPATARVQRPAEWAGRTVRVALGAPTVAEEGTALSITVSGGSVAILSAGPGAH
jgi:glycosidase